ncbi:hypothetical protein ACVWVY_003659 [Bradyrhizobium sp. URHC0002]
MSAPVMWSLFVILSGSPQMQLLGPWPVSALAKP